MTDVFNDIFTMVATAVRNEYPGCFVTGEWVNAPAQFPTVSVVEADNYVDAASRDNSLTENVTVLMYQVTVYSNLTSGKRYECAKILGFIDDLLRVKNFTRIARSESYYDTEKTIYTMTARYRVRVGKREQDGSFNLYTI